MNLLKIFFTITIFAVTIMAQTQLSKYKISGAKPRQVELSKKLKEISGLALTSDERLFAHGDEIGTIYQIDFKTGDIIKEFQLGDKKVEEDFEGISLANGKFYLVVSDGNLYEFEEDKDGGKVDYKIFETRLKQKYDVEGLCFDPETNSLLLACKEFAGKDLEKSRAVYSFDLEKKELSEEPRFVISLSKLEKKWNVDEFKPSAIEKTPSGSYLILGGKGLVVLEISSKGKIIDEMILSEEYHHQPEGIAILEDGTLVISDEAGKGRATLTFYNYKSK